jgi:hypothetical protein
MLWGQKTMPGASQRVGKVRYLCACCIAALLIVGDGIAFAAGITQGRDWSALVGLAIFLVPLMIGVPWGLIASTRWRWHAAQIIHTLPASGDAPISALQAERDLALASGETVAISRIIPNRRLWNVIWGYLFIVPFLGLFCESGLITLFQIHWPPETSLATFSARLSPMLAVTLAMPMVLALLLFLPTILGDRFVRRLRLHADDDGLTVTRGFHSITFPWDEIHLCLYIPTRYSHRSNLAFDGTYVIGNRTRQVAVTLYFRDILYPKSAMQFSPRSWQWIWEWERVLATIAERSLCPMRVPTVRQAQSQQMAEAERDDVGVQLDPPPLVPALLQPRPDLVAAMQHAPATVVLRPRVRVGRILSLSAKMTGFIGGIVVVSFGSGWLASAVGLASQKDSLMFDNPMEFAIFAGPMLIMLACISLWFGITSVYEKRPTIIADAKGITQKMRKQKQSRTLAWEQIEQWVVTPLGDDPAQGMNYRLVALKPRVQSIWWNEVPGDTLADPKGTQAAFQERAEQLHALIAARTGLILMQDQHIQPRKRPLLLRILL